MIGLYEALPERPDFDKSKYKLGQLCGKGHDWNGTGQGLRYINGGKCIACQKLWYQSNMEDQRCKARERMAARREDPEQRLILNERTRVCQANRRAIHGRPSRANPDAAQRRLRNAIARAGRCPSVARLVMNEQRRYWRENPEAKREHDRQWDRVSWWLEYQTKPELRLYIRQKSKRRKAQMRDSVAIQLSGKQVRARFDEFANRCAFCGIDLMTLPKKHRHIEHVVPLVKGGPHALGNIVPACKSCNDSKRSKDVETWYRSQPFFSKTRWRKICRVLGWDRSAVGQLALL
jgi:hypothetical protein